jgi:hypothetical protein
VRIMVGVPESRYKYGTFSVAGTVAITANPVILHTINLTDTTAGNVTVLAGTAVGSGTAVLLTAGTQNSYIFDAEMTGLSIVTSGNTKGNFTYVLI